VAGPALVVAAVATLAGLVTLGGLLGVDTPPATRRPDASAE
jgi:hypothetical protein